MNLREKGTRVKQRTLSARGPAWKCPTHLVHHGALMSSGHPKRIEAITAEWLTRVLREGGVCRVLDR